MLVLIYLAIHLPNIKHPLYVPGMVLDSRLTGVQDEQEPLTPGVYFLVGNTSTGTFFACFHTHKHTYEYKQKVLNTMMRKHKLQDR